jgi:uncharacterized RDD family membrane protein YckC
VNTQHTQVVYPAGFVSRAAAFIFDLIIIAMITALTLVAVNLLVDFFRATLFDALVKDTRLENVYTLIWRILDFALSYLLVLGYFAICWSLVGFTPGMYLMGLRVVRKNGELPSFFRSLARVFLFTLSALVFFLGFLWVMVDKRRQAWHDKIVGTYVVYMDLPGNTDSPYVEPAPLGKRTPAQP